MAKLFRTLLFFVFISVPLYVGLDNFAAFEPYLFPLHMFQAGPLSSGPRIYGPFPDAHSLETLKERGYHTVVSLLDPQVIYERSLLDRERQDTLALGLRFHDFPMRGDEPADSPRNAAAISEIRALLRGAPTERIYIHGYLGKHRSRTVLAAIEGKR
jgi:hypothetical protein